MVEVRFVAGTPEFTWEPACGVSRVSVRRFSTRPEGGDVVWAVDVNNPGVIAPGVRYGRTPPGAQVRQPAVMLTPGASYTVYVRYIVGGDVLAGGGGAEFTQP